MSNKESILKRASSFSRYRKCTNHVCRVLTILSIWNGCKCLFKLFKSVWILRTLTQNVYNSHKTQFQNLVCSFTKYRRVKLQSRFFSKWRNPRYGSLEIRRRVCLEKQLYINTYVPDRCSVVAVAMYTIVVINIFTTG